MNTWISLFCNCHYQYIKLLYALLFVIIVIYIIFRWKIVIYIIDLSLILFNIFITYTMKRLINIGYETYIRTHKDIDFFYIISLFSLFMFCKSILYSLHS